MDQIEVELRFMVHGNEKNKRGGPIWKIHQQKRKRKK